jgi:hypothetical protein
MEKEELLKRFNENVAYLERNIPPDDIYLFTEQTFMAALYFLHRWSECEDINAVCQEDSIAKKWVLNILGLMQSRSMQQDVKIDLGMEKMCD